MSVKTTAGLENSGTDVQLSQELSHLEIPSPNDGNPACQVCGERITEGESVTLYLSRTPGRARYSIGQCRCADHNEDLTAQFTLGVREVIVDGRVGHCRHHDKNQTQLILVALAVRLISAPDTTSGRVVGDADRTHPNDSGQDRLTGRNRTALADNCDTQSALSHADRDGSAITSKPRSARRLDDE